MDLVLVHDDVDGEILVLVTDTEILNEIVKGIVIGWMTMLSPNIGSLPLNQGILY